MFFLGEKNMIDKKLIYPNIDTYVNDYDPCENPSVFKEHATAAYRHFHTLIRGYLEWDENVYYFYNQHGIFFCLDKLIIFV